jgi:hypothetical protein
MLVRKLTDPSVDTVVSKVKKQISHNSPELWLIYA